jgi:hypothetical protein
MAVSFVVVGNRSARRKPPTCRKSLRNVISPCNSIKTFDFSTLYTTIPNSKLKDRLRELVQLCFIKKNVLRRYKYLVLGRDRSYFMKSHFVSTRKFSETDIINMLDFCAPLLADLFLYSYEADFMHWLLKKISCSAI